MKKKLICLLLLVIGVLFGLGITNEILGMDFPTRTIELVVHRGVGGSTSMAGRILAGTLSEFIGGPVVVIHKPGGAGSAAPMYVIRSKPDGHTLLISNTFTNGNVLAIRSLEYKNSDFEFLGQWGTMAMAIAVRGDAPWRTFQELVADAKKEPGKLKCATSGVGSQGQFFWEWVKMELGGLDVGHVPFKSAAESTMALLGGHVDVVSTYVTDINEFVAAGKIRILAVPEEKRLEEFPNSPTFAELGYPKLKMFVRYGIATRVGVPKEISDKLKDALYKTFNHPEVKQLLLNIRIKSVYINAEEYTKITIAEEGIFRRIAKEANIKVE